MLLALAFVNACETRVNLNPQRYLHLSAVDAGIPVRFQKRQAAFSDSAELELKEGTSPWIPFVRGQF